jgi:hypothetical protein
MKALIIGLGVVVGCACFFMACVSVDRGGQKEASAQHLSSEIVELKQKVLLLKDIPQREPVHLDKAYTAFINDMHVIAGAYRMACTVSVQGRNGVDVDKNAVPSVFAGLREVHFHGVFSGVVRRTTLLSLLDALSAFEKEAPVLFQGISHEKDALAFDVIVVGL